MPSKPLDQTAGMHAAQADAVREAPTENFVELLRAARLDPAKHLRFANWSGADFRGCDLRGFDFTGARLIGCDFAGAQIGGARFDQAEIEQAGHAPVGGADWGDDWGSDWAPAPTIVTMRKAADWDAYVAGWRRPERLVRDAHLPVGAVLQDAPFGPELVVVPPGPFQMGSSDEEPEREDDEGPQREVTIAQALAVGRYAVTFAEWDFAQADKEWRKITKLKPRKAGDQGWGRSDRPVIDVSWDDAQAYARWLSAKTGQAYRLLSEAEWEYCCRAGTTTPFWWGSAITPHHANYNGNYVYDGGEKGEYRNQTVPVDAFAPNPWGLYQTHGNVWEWVEEVWHDSYADAPVDGSALTSGDRSLRVLRGGSLISNPRDLRAAARLWIMPVIRLYRIGFRLSRTLNL